MSASDASRRTDKNVSSRTCIVTMSSDKISTVNFKKNKNKKYASTSAKLKKEAKTPAKSKVKDVETKATLIRKPFKPDEVSSNWKTLLQVIKPPRTGTLPPYRKRKLASSSNEPDSKKQTTTSRDEQTTESTEDVWFDNVDPILLDGSSKASALTQAEGTKE
jgi:hypothetical protein